MINRRRRAVINKVVIKKFFKDFIFDIAWLFYGISMLCFTGTSGDAKRLDLDAVGTVKDVSIYEYDIDLGTDEKPWRKPGWYQLL